MSYKKLLPSFLALVLIFSALGAPLSMAHEAEIHLADPGKLPSSFGYWFKTFGESLKLHILTWGDVKDGNLRLQYSERRLAEINLLWDQNKLEVSEAQALTKEYITHIVKSTRNTKDVNLLSDAFSKIGNHESALHLILEKMTGSIQHRSSVVLAEVQAKEVRNDIVEKLLAMPDLSKEIHDKIAQEIDQDRKNLETELQTAKTDLDNARKNGSDVALAQQQYTVATELLKNVDANIKAGKLAQAFREVNQAQVAVEAVQTALKNVTTTVGMPTTGDPNASDVPDNLRGDTPPFSDPNSQNPQTSNKNKFVIIANNSFTPQVLDVAVGDTVIFRNDDNEPHWPAVDPHPQHTGLPGFDAGKGLVKGESFSFTFRSAGTFTYHDHMNAGIKGTIRVR